MTWAKIDDGLDEHPKVDAMLEADELTALAAVGLWVLTLANASRRGTDGHVTARTLGRIAPEHGARLAAVLRDAGLYDEATGGHAIHDFLHYNPSAAEVAAATRARSEAGKAGAAKRWGSRTDAAGANADGVASATATDGKGHSATHADRNGSSSCDRNAPDPTRPDPTPKGDSPRAGAREAGPEPQGSQPPDDLPGYIVGVLQRGIDGLSGDKPARRPTRKAIEKALAAHPVGEDVARAVAIDTRATVQAQDRAPNVAGLFAQKLAKAAAGEAA